MLEAILGSLCGRGGEGFGDIFVKLRDEGRGRDRVLERRRYLDVLRLMKKLLGGQHQHSKCRVPSLPTADALPAQMPPLQCNSMLKLTKTLPYLDHPEP